MKPFCLKSALAGKPVITRDGRPVKIAGYNPDATENARLLLWDADNVARIAYEDGKIGMAGVDSLFMAPTERKEWVVRTDRGKLYGPMVTERHAFQIQSCEGGTIHEITITD